MPALPFISLALVFLIAAMTSTGGPNPKEITVPKFQPRIPPLLQIEVGKCLAKPLYELGTVTETLETFRQKVFDESGVMLAAAEVSVDAALDSAFRIRMRGLEVHSEKAEGAPLEILERIVQKLDELVKSRLAEFVDDILTRRTLDQFDKEAPELVAAVVPGIVSVTQLTEILRALVKDGLTIRNLDLILQAVAETGPKAPHELISARHRSSDGKIYALSVSALHDVAICSCEKEVRQIEPALTTKLAAELRKRDLEGKVLLASKGARRLLQEAVENMGFSIKAIAYEELEPEVEVTHEAILLPSALEEAELLEALAA
jgi:flagellar biosynthesis component FlhA